MKSFLSRIQQRAFAPVDIASLVFFRIGFGLLMAWEVCRYFRNESIYHFWLEPKFLFKYYGFSWVHPWPGDWLYIHWAVLGVLALFVTFGFLYRLSASLMFLSYAYFFLLDEARYVNHTYLICLYCLLLVVVPAHRAFSIDARLRPSLRSDTAPAWSLWLLKFQIAVVYIFAGLVKLSPDWLQGEPMRYRLAHATDAPLVGQFFGYEWMVYLMTYGGLIFDLSVVPLLLWRRTRPVTFCAVVIFHVINALWAIIGMFPWLAIAASALFFPPDWPRRILEKLEFTRRRKVVKESRPPTALHRGLVVSGLRLGGSGALLFGRLDHRDLGVVRDGGALLDEDLLQDARERRRDLGIDLVGDDLEQRLVLLDGVAWLLEPLADRPLGHALAELRHRHLGHWSFLRVAGRIEPAITCSGPSVAHRASTRRGAGRSARSRT